MLRISTQVLVNETASVQMKYQFLVFSTVITLNFSLCSGKLQANTTKANRRDVRNVLSQLHLPNPADFGDMGRYMDAITSDMAKDSLGRDLIAESPSDSIYPQEPNGHYNAPKAYNPLAISAGRMLVQLVMNFLDRELTSVWDSATEFLRHHMSDKHDHHDGHSGSNNHRFDNKYMYIYTVKYKDGSIHKFNTTVYPEDNQSYTYLFTKFRQYGDIVDVDVKGQVIDSMNHVVIKPPVKTLYETTQKISLPPSFEEVTMPQESFKEISRHEKTSSELPTPQRPVKDAATQQKPSTEGSVHYELSKEIPKHQIPLNDVPRHQKPSKKFTTVQETSEEISTYPSSIEVPRHQKPLKEVPTHQKPSKEKPPKQVIMHQEPSKDAATQQDPSPKDTTHQEKSKEIPRYQRPSNGVPENQKPSKKLATLQKPSVEVSTHQNSSNEVLRHQKLSKEVPTHEQPSKEVTMHQELSKDATAPQKPSTKGKMNHESSKEISGHQIPSNEVPTVQKTSKELTKLQEPFKEVSTNRNSSREVPRYQNPPKEVPTHPKLSEDVPTLEKPSKEVISHQKPPTEGTVHQESSKDIPRHQTPSNEVPTKQKPSKELTTLQEPSDEVSTHHYEVRRHQKFPEEVPTHQKPSEEFTLLQKPPEQASVQQKDPTKVSTHQDVSKEFQRNQTPTSEVTTHQKTSKDFTTHQKPSKEFITLPEPSEDASMYQKTSRKVSTNQDSFKEVPRYQKTSNEVPTHQNLFKELTTLQESLEEVSTHRNPSKMVSAHQEPPSGTKAKVDGGRRSNLKANHTPAGPWNYHVGRNHSYDTSSNLREDIVDQHEMHVLNAGLGNTESPLLTYPTVESHSGGDQNHTEKILRTVSIFDEHIEKENDRNVDPVTSNHQHKPHIAKYIDNHQKSPILKGDRGSWESHPDNATTKYSTSKENDLEGTMKTHEQNYSTNPPKLGAYTSVYNKYSGGFGENVSYHKTNRNEIITSSSSSANDSDPRMNPHRFPLGRQSQESISNKTEPNPNSHEPMSTDRGHNSTDYSDRSTDNGTDRLTAALTETDIRNNTYNYSKVPEGLSRLLHGSEGRRRRSGKFSKVLQKRSFLAT